VGDQFWQVVVVDLLADGVVLELLDLVTVIPRGQGLTGVMRTSSRRQSSSGEM
jgi:hypothetical protein